MSLTELQGAILVRLIGKREETQIACTYPEWLEKRMAQHRHWVRAHFIVEQQRTAPMKKLLHEQFYALGQAVNNGKESERRQRVSAKAAGR